MDSWELFCHLCKTVVDEQNVFLEASTAYLDVVRDTAIVELQKNNEKLQVKVIRLAAREDVDIPVEEHLIVELYSK